MMRVMSRKCSTFITLVVILATLTAFVPCFGNLPPDTTPPILYIAPYGSGYYAAVGTTIPISVAASETLSGNPYVSVNGHAATFYGKSSSGIYNYSYTLQSSDVGWVTITAYGYDLACLCGSGSLANAFYVYDPN